jgi:hypothetical protein
MAGCCIKLSLPAGAGEPPGAWAARWGLARRRSPQHQSSMCCDISLVTIPFYSGVEATTVCFCGKSTCLRCHLGAELSKNLTRRQPYVEPGLQSTR